MMLKKNDEIELYIEDFTSEGSGVGHFEGMAVFVSGAAAGDKAFVHIIKVKSTYAIGKCIKLLKPSKTRIAPDCEYAGSCGGCAFRHISYEAETAMKKKRVEDAFQRIGGINKKLDGFIAAENLTRYRNKAEYPVSFEKELKIGFYALHTHRIIDCRDCVLQPEIFADIVAVIRKWTVEFGISIYNSETGNGLLRHIYIRQGAVSKEIMVCLVINGERIPKEAELVKRLCEIPDIKSIVLNINRLNNNVILGEECKTVYGADCIYDELCGVKIRLSPLSFYQVNHAQAEKLYRKAAECAQLDGSQTVLDMYCGAGTIGLSMADKAKNVIGVEIVEPAVRDAKINAGLNGIKNAQFYCADASQAAQMLKEQGIKPDVIVLDPPRKGCSQELVKTVSEMQPDRVVYVSCDPATLARDCKRFGELGYKVEKLTAVDLFPRTVHCEAVALLTK
ncbi:MAG: 23S rRNA (uracil(1939)-C(5))-methyltransferase RlmD [Clostridia bacterium]|nr:23S rRNA (uracil(1939)-C(5))-methyltransferase RlmD [Clostridia bacterium]